MTSTGPNVKGSALLARVKYVHAHHGEAGYQRLLDTLTPEHRAALSGEILPASWVPFDLFVATNVALDRTFGAGDLRLVVDIARYAAEVNLTTLYRIFYRLSNPSYILGKAASLWRLNYDSGQLEVVKESGGATMTIRDFAQPHRAHCWSVLGWATRSVELSGGRDVVIDELSCRADGGRTCEMRVRWR